MEWSDIMYYSGVYVRSYDGQSVSNVMYNMLFSLLMNDINF